MAVNKKKLMPRKIKEELRTAHTNFMGAPSYDIKSPLLRLICISASSFFGEPSYYKGQGPTVTKRFPRSGLDISLTTADRKRLREELNAIDDYRWRNMTPEQTMETAIKESLDYNPEATLNWASVLRNEEHIRVTPQVILVMAANHPKLKGSGLVRKFAPKIIGRADEVSTQLAYQLDKFGKPVPNSLRRAWKDYLSKATEYQLAKYRMENREVKTVDVANLAMGKGFYGYDTPIGKLMRGELSLGGEIQTWESIISGGGKWEDAVEVMGHMALLRNIRNLLTNKVPTSKWLDKLVATAKTGKQLPFRYFSAYKANENAPPHVRKAIETCLDLSVGNLPQLKGSSLVLTDNSGSARGVFTSELGSVSCAQIGNLMGVLTGKVSEEGIVGTFGDKLALTKIDKTRSVLEQAYKIDEVGKTVGQATENGLWLALDRIITLKEHFDNIFVYSDMQAGHGGLFGTGSVKNEYVWRSARTIRSHNYIDVPRLIRKYRSTVNPKVNVFLVQIAGYEDTIIPEFYDRTYIIGGWSGSIIKFARRMVDTIDQFESLV